MIHTCRGNAATLPDGRDTAINHLRRTYSSVESTLCESIRKGLVMH